jgi:hypothetical protein
MFSLAFKGLNTLHLTWKDYLTLVSVYDEPGSSVSAVCVATGWMTGQSRFDSFSFSFSSRTSIDVIVSQMLCLNLSSVWRLFEYTLSCSQKKSEVCCWHTSLN